MPPKDKKSLKHYFINLFRITITFPCPQCGNSVFSKEYEKHCSTLHNLNTKLSCVWCQGNVSWKKGEKCDHADHLLECFRKFMARNVPNESPPHYTTYDLSPMCPGKECFGHSKTRNLSPRAFEPVWPMPLDPILPTFQDDGLNLAVSCIRKYLDLQDSTEWFHVMVRAVAFSSFLQAMDEDEGRTRSLIFSCWCDGGTCKEAIHRQHRHMIVVSPKDHFVRNVWKKIGISEEERPYKNYPCIRRKAIQSPMHLVNTLGYFSQRKSRCNFSFKDNLPKKDNHFYIFQTLPADYKLVLVLQWDGGIMELIRQEFRNVDTGKLLHAPMIFSERRWQLKIKDLPGMRLDLALPISEHFMPAEGPTDIFLHLTGGKKLYFQPSSGQTSTAATMPLFYNVIGEESWDPRHSQQNILNIIKPIVDQNTELVAEIRCQKRKYEETIDDLRRKYEETIADLRRKHEDSVERVQSLLTKMNGLYEGEIVRLKTENNMLKEEIDTLKRAKTS